MSHSAVSTCFQDQTVHVRVDGRAVAHDCPALRRYVESAVKNGFRKVLVHLQRCEHFDSTFLGTLLCLKRFPTDSEPVDLRLASVSEEAQAILKRMGAAMLFNSDDKCDCPTQGKWFTCEPEQAGNCSIDFKQNVVQAHQRLGEVEGPLGATYRQIAEMAAQDLEAAQNR